MLGVILCFYMNFYNLSEMNAKHKLQSYKIQQEQLNKLTEKLKKENDLYTNLNERQIKGLFQKLNEEVENRKKIDNSDSYNGKKKEFLTILQIKLLEKRNIKDSTNNRSGNYIKEYLDITAIKIGNLDQPLIIIIGVLIILFSCVFILTYWTFIIGIFYAGY